MVITITSLREMPGICTQGRKEALEFLAGLPENSPVDFGEWTQGLLLAHPYMRKHWGWAVHIGVVPGYSMAWLDFSGADLAGADLYKADLRGANLYKANLYKADLRGANLRGADLRGTSLLGANLGGANLSGANLSGMDLSGVDFRGARFQCADLRGARLSEAFTFGADFTDALI